MSYISTQFSKTFKRPAKPSLKQQLDDKSTELRSQADTHVSVADSLVRAAADEKAQARTKASHAAAVEKAYAVLNDAGVEL